MDKMTDTQKRILLMRSGEKIDCPICKKGKWAAVGNPKTTPLFQCDNCKEILSITRAKQRAN